MKFLRYSCVGLAIILGFITIVASASGPAPTLYGACCESDAPAYTCTDDVTEAECDSTGGTWIAEGTCGEDVLCNPTPADNALPIYRYLNGDSATVDHYYSSIYTTDTFYGYSIELGGDPVFTVDEKRTATNSPIYEYWNATERDHYYTGTAAPAGYVIQKDGVPVFYADLTPTDTNSTPIYRYHWNEPDGGLGLSNDFLTNGNPAGFCLPPGGVYWCYDYMGIAFYARPIE